MRAAIGGLLLFATVAQAQDLSPPSIAIKPPPAATIIGPGNLPPDFYPKSPCTKPDISSIPEKPRDERDQKAVLDYNQKVQAYNKLAKAFNPCVTDYGTRANNDIARIQAAIRDANAH